MLISAERFPTWPYHRGVVPQRAPSNTPCSAPGLQLLWIRSSRIPNNPRVSCPGSHEGKDDIGLIVNGIRQIRGHLDRYSKELSRSSQITVPQLGVLHVVDRCPETTRGKVSPRTYIRPKVG